MSKRGLTLYGLVNAIFMYLMAPVFRMTEVLAEYYESIVCVGIYFLMYVIHIAANVLLYYKLCKKAEHTKILNMSYVFLGCVIGNLFAIAVTMVVFSIGVIPEGYWYLNTVPYRLYTIDGMKYFMFVIIYILFVCELSNKILLAIRKEKITTEQEK